MTVVSDSSPLILFARIDRLDLLPALFDDVWTPPRVAGETCRDVPSRPGAAALAAATGDWLRIVAPASLQQVFTNASHIDAGVVAAIALAAEHFGGRMEVLDFYHACEHLWTLPQALPGTDTVES